VILKLTIVHPFLLILHLPYLLIMAEIPIIYPFQKDNFSHANLTISNIDVRIILNDDTSRTHPCHKVAIFQDHLELMWDFHSHHIIVTDNPNDTQVTGQIVEVPNLIQQTGYPTLSTEQALVSNHMVTPFSVQPCETLNQEGNNINSFLF